MPAADMEESVRFYKECVGPEQIPAPRLGFGGAVRWLRLGGLPLRRITVYELPPRRARHFGVEFGAFASADRTLNATGIFSPAGERAPASVWELPGGEGQMYL